MQSARRQTLVLWFLGTVFAIGALFAPAGPWTGLDLGATSAALFLLVLAGVIRIFSVRANDVFPDELSAGERDAWVSLAFLSLILLTFLRHFWTLSLQEDPRGIRDLLPDSFPRQLVVLVAAWWWISHLVVRAAGGVEKDERDLRVQDRAYRVSDWAFTSIVILSIVVLVIVPAQQVEWWLAPMILGNLLIGLLIARSLLEHVAVAWMYRAARR
jgi:hypothetical protein